MSAVSRGIFDSLSFAQGVAGASSRTASKPQVIKRLGPLPTQGCPRKRCRSLTDPCEICFNFQALNSDARSCPPEAKVTPKAIRRRAPRTLRSSRASRQDVKTEKQTLYITPPKDVGDCNDTKPRTELYLRSDPICYGCSAVV